VGLAVVSVTCPPVDMLQGEIDSKEENFESIRSKGEVSWTRGQDTVRDRNTGGVVSQSVSQSVCLSVCQSVCQSVTQLYVFPCLQYSTDFNNSKLSYFYTYKAHTYCSRGCVVVSM